MGNLDHTSTTEVLTAPEHDGFEVVQWDIRPTSASSDPDAEMDNGCGCGCGCN